MGFTTLSTVAFIISDHLPPSIFAVYTHFGLGFHGQVITCLNVDVQTELSPVTNGWPYPNLSGKTYKEGVRILKQQATTFDVNSVPELRKEFCWNPTQGVVSSVSDIQCTPLAYSLCLLLHCPIVL